MGDAGFHLSKILICPDSWTVLHGGIIASRRVAEMFFSPGWWELKTWKSRMWTSVQEFKPHQSEKVANSWNGFANSLVDISERFFFLYQFSRGQENSCKTAIWALLLHRRKTFPNLVLFFRHKKVPFALLPAGYNSYFRFQVRMRS